MLSLSRRVILASAKSTARNTLWAVALQTEHERTESELYGGMSPLSSNNNNKMFSLIGIGRSGLRSLLCWHAFCNFRKYWWSGGQWCYHSLNIDTAKQRLAADLIIKSLARTIFFDTIMSSHMIQQGNLFATTRWSCILLLSLFAFSSPNDLNRRQKSLHHKKSTLT